MGLLKKFVSGFLVLGFSMIPFLVMAEEAINLEGPDLLPKTELYITPRTGNFLVGSTFEVPVYLDTKGHSINAVSLKIRFDPKKLAITKPSSGKSIFGIWIETPNYDNTKGTASLVGVIPGGIVTSSGLIGIITFKAMAAGKANISISDYTSANLNDGFGSEAKLSLHGANYTLSPVPPEGVIILSETHPREDEWSNNNSPIFSWQSPEPARGYSIVFDNNPTTIPTNEINMRDSFKSYQEIGDGIWYFHVKAQVNDLWGNTSHYKIKIDTVPPAEFKPAASVMESSSTDKKYLLSFLTTDSLSGLNHYEVGSINKNDIVTVSPVFVESESPYLVPGGSADSLKVIVRAYDQAGNIREAKIDLYPGYNFLTLFKKYGTYILIVVLILLLLEILFHFLFGHHVLAHLKKAYSYFRGMSNKETTDNGEFDKIPLPPLYYNVAVQPPNSNTPASNFESPKRIDDNPAKVAYDNQKEVPTQTDLPKKPLAQPEDLLISNEEYLSKDYLNNSLLTDNLAPKTEINYSPIFSETPQSPAPKISENNSSQEEQFKSNMEKFINPKLIPVNKLIRDNQPNSK